MSPLLAIEARNTVAAAAPQHAIARKNRMAGSAAYFRRQRHVAKLGAPSPQSLQIFIIADPQRSVSRHRHSRRIARARRQRHSSRRQAAGIESGQPSGKRQHPDGAISPQGQFADRIAPQTIFFCPHPPAVLRRLPHRQAVVGAHPEAPGIIAQLAPNYVVRQSFLPRPARPHLRSRPAVEAAPAIADPDGAFAVIHRGKYRV